MVVATSYLIDDGADGADEKVKAALVEAVEKFSGVKHSENDAQLDDQHFTISKSHKVDPTIADDIKASALNASIYSLIAIFFYILFRFKKWQFSTGAIIATAHDALFVIAAFGIAHAFGLSFEIDQIFVAALLSIFGFSINYTLIIFDRIREYISFGAKHDRHPGFNDAINS